MICHVLIKKRCNTFSFNAEAGQIYTIALGGYSTGGWTDTLDGYKLTVSQVPIPGTVWLFGGTFVALGAIILFDESVALTLSARL